MRKLLPENIEAGSPLAEASPSALDLEALRAHNQSALSEGKEMIWVDHQSDVIAWDSAIKELGEKTAQPKEYVFRDVTLFFKEGRHGANG